MNLRTLKKLSKRAVAILRAHYAGQIPEMFLAERGENYHGLVIRCRHYKRGRHDNCHRCEVGHPLKGTPMVGDTVGYYEPEWEEETTWERLSELVLWGGRPKTMTDAEWVETLKVARVIPFTEAELRAMAGEPAREAA